MSGGNRSRRVEEVLAEATALLSGLSHCAGLVIAPKSNARLKHIEFVSLAPGRGLVILVAEDGTVENRTIDLPAGLPPSVLVKASNYLSARMQGKTIGEVQRLMQLEISTLRTELDELTAKVIADGVATWSGNAGEDDRTLIVKGQGNLIENLTALEDLERIRQLFDDLESKKGLIQLLGLAETGEGVRIFIGAENKLFSMSGSSLIVAPYRNSEEKIVGALGIIGPTRMNYARIIPMVDYTARIVGRLIT
jgi:heat-inducible transcriptional repressor